MGTSAATTTGEHCGASCRAGCDCPAPLQGDELQAAKAQAAIDDEIVAANAEARSVFSGCEGLLLDTLEAWQEAGCTCRDGEGLHDHSDTRCELTIAEDSLTTLLDNLKGARELVKILGAR